MDMKKTEATKTADPAAPEDLAPEDPAPADGLLAGLDADDDADETDLAALDEMDSRPPSGVGSAVLALSGAGLAVAALTGTWVSRVLSERQTLIGQIDSADATTSAAKISALYGDAWHVTALTNGAFAAVALLLGLFVLVRPAFGAPGRILPVWVRAAAGSAVVLSLLGLLVAVLMYTDVFTPLPTAP
ncbi:hypothetical protein [Streptomyces sp. NPDC097619]|uniref:hypothetical protein n=1 Tax=Streptomyces sp. NPDC097619 TaxID=3157228 RepID=UPI00332365A0